MTTQTAVPNVSAVARHPEQAERRTVLGGEIAVRLRGEETDGLCALIENTIPAGYAGPPLHFHEHTDELFYVIGGEIAFRLGEEVFAGGPGAVVHVPRGAVHTFANLEQRPALVLNYCTAGTERFFDDLAAALADADGELNPATFARLAALHDTHLVAAVSTSGVAKGDRA
jgi:mannose-6-phosphate isomerase-like protein (cupin superfamily)